MSESEDWRLRNNLDAILALTAFASPEPIQTAIPNVMVIKGDVPQHQLAAVYEPMIGFLIQGEKVVTIGERDIVLKPLSYFVVPTETPATARVFQGENGEPYLSIALRLNYNSLHALLSDLPDTTWKENTSTNVASCPATSEFVDAWTRMLKLLKTPKDIPALAPAYEREILYRVLLGPQGERLRKICQDQHKLHRIRQAILWIRENYPINFDIKEVAIRTGMAVTTFHRKFKEATGLTPIQFQKQLRLLEARKLLVYGDWSVNHAALEVGYESPTQFSREYSRFFGASPARNAAALKRIGQLSL